MNTVADFSALESLAPKQQWLWLTEWLQGGVQAGYELLDYLQKRAQSPQFPQVLDGRIYELLWRA